jgi:hypothetical protein
MSIFPEWTGTPTPIPNRAKEKTIKYWNKTPKPDLPYV